MTEPDSEYLTEAEAASLWQRAARLQAEAAQRAETRVEERDRKVDTGASAEGYALTHVRTAAAEAGIGEEFVDAALADVRLERALPRKRRGRGLARWVLGNPADAITVRRVITAPAADVLKAMEELLPEEPYRLTLTDRQGDPLLGGVLVFDIQGAGFTVTQGFVGEASWADLRQVFVSVVPVGGPEGPCEVTARGPVAWAFNLNLAVGSVIVGAGGGLGLGVGSALAAAIGALGASVSLGAVWMILAVLGVMSTTAGGAALGVAGLRGLYSHGLGKGRKALEGMLATVAMRAQGGWGWGLTAGGDSARLPAGGDTTPQP